MGLTSARMRPRAGHVNPRQPPAHNTGEEARQIHDLVNQDWQSTRSLPNVPCRH